MLGGQCISDSSKHICNRVCHLLFLLYQLAFLTPGIWPLYAKSRKQTLQMPYFLRTAWGRPQILQRVYSLVENFCGLDCLTFCEVLAIKTVPPYFAKGMPINLKSSRASSSVFAVVTIQISKPRTFSIWSYEISGKMSCSLTPSA